MIENDLDPRTLTTVTVADFNTSTGEPARRVEVTTEVLNRWYDTLERVSNILFWYEDEHRNGSYIEEADTINEIAAYLIHPDIIEFHQTFGDYELVKKGEE